MSFLRVYFAFAAGYLLSYLLRSTNAVISPELTRELALTPGALGLLTSVYFVSFAAIQIPVGMLLDRFGPRRVEPAMLLIAGTGALGFALATDLTGLAIARAMIGVGVAACLMAPLKAIATWFPPDRQAALGGWIMVAGGLGAIGATAPLELALRFVDWRTIFLALAATTYAVAAWLWLRVPDVPTPAHGTGLAEQWAGVREVFAHARFWWIAPLGGFGMGSFFAIQGLWSVPWLMEVGGFDRAGAARHLLAIGVVMLAAYAGMGLFAMRLARRGIHARHLFGGGFALAGAALAAIVFTLPGSYFWWMLYGLGIATNILAYPTLNDGFATELTGRANTALNLMMFGASFAAQWGIGVVVDVARAGLGFDTAGGLRLALSIVLALHVGACIWFAYGWRRHAGRGRETVAAS